MDKPPSTEAAPSEGVTNARSLARHGEQATMPDRVKSIPPCPSDDLKDWKELSPFRETFLQYLTDAPTRDALLHLGDEAYQMVLEWRRFWPEREGSSIRHDLEAVMADLVYLAGYLEHQIGGHLGTSSLSEEELRLAQAARRLAKQVSEIMLEATKALDIGTES